MSGQLQLFSPAEEPARHLQALNEQQWAAVEAPADRGVQVLAGAGTGKTELISRRFVKLVHDFRRQGLASPEERILVLTFTSDAALNMRERIHRRLVETGAGELGPNAWIGTFHQFGMRLLRTHALEAGLLPDFSMLNVLEQQVLCQRVVQGILAGDYRDLSDTLTRFGLDLPADALKPETLAASGIPELETLLEPGLIYRFITRVKTAGLSPREFLESAIQQSEKLTERLKSMPVPHNPDLDKQENMMLKLMAWQDALSPWAHDGWNPVQIASDKAERSGKKLTPSVLLEELKGLGKLYLSARVYEPMTPDVSILDEALSQEKQVASVFAAVYALYQDALRSKNACDFDDLINHTIQLLLERPVLRERYRKQFAAVIVDEFQDSNGSQLRLLELLVREQAANLTVVGDEKQSIYAFRFAQPENLNLIFRNGDPLRINLQTNYRSRPPILAVANRLTKDLTQDPAQMLSACEKNATQMDPLVTWLNLDEMLEENGKAVAKPIFEYKEREAQFIAIEIARLVESGECRFSDIAVLVKSHTKAEAIQQALTKLHIPSIKQKNMGFFQEPEIKDAMALLRLMRNPHDELSLVRLLQKKLNHRQLYRLVSLKRKLAQESGMPISLFALCLELKAHADALADLPAGLLEAIADLAEQLRDLHKLKNRLTPVHLFLKLAAQIGLIDAKSPAWRKKRQRVTLRMFEKLLHLFSRSKTLQPTLDEVLEILERYEAHPEEELPVKEELDGEDAVQIMTVFASKGLEFKVVFAAYADSERNAGAGEDPVLFDPQYPGKAGFGLILGKVNGLANLKREIRQRCWHSPRGKAEAQRVFYVALTRAMERLYVIRCHHSPDWTAPADYPRSAVRVLSESQDEGHLEKEYWNVDLEPLRQKMTLLQEKVEGIF